MDPDSGLMTAETLEQALARAEAPARAVLPVHLGGRLCPMAGIEDVAAEAGAVVVEDAAHAVGGVDAVGAPVGACAHSAATTFSFHPVKTLAAGEGGMVTVNDAARAARIAAPQEPRRHPRPRPDDRARLPRRHGARNPWIYEQVELGFNYRMNEMEAALGLSQLGKLERFAARRRALADRYEALLRPLALLTTPVPRGPGAPGLHLFSVLIDFEAAGVSRAELMTRLAAEGVGTQVHYIPLYRQPWFRARYGRMRLPGAEAYYARVLALPLFPAMQDRTLTGWSRRWRGRSASDAMKRGPVDGMMLATGCDP